MEDASTNINDLSTYDGSEKDYFNIAVYFMDAMRRLVLKNTKYNDIGGPIQYMILDHKGPRSFELSFTSDPTGKKDKWHRTTARTHEITTYRGRWDLDPKYLDRNSFDVHSYCD